MKASKAGGQEIIDQLVQNSETWAQKTKFSKQKYIRKKREKYSIIFEVRRPTALNLCEAYHFTQSSKICNLRPDSLALMLNIANINYQSRVLIVENTKGFLCGVLIEKAIAYGLRVDFTSDIVNLADKQDLPRTVGMIRPNVQILREFNFDPSD